MKATKILGLVAIAWQGLFASAYGHCSHSAACCQRLSRAAGLSGKVYSPDSVSYADRMSTYWSVSAALLPWCVIQPSNAEDVSVTITTLASHNCSFGVRGGGHGSFAGSNSVENGVTIDFGNMNSTTYDPDTKLASIQPGAHWQTVYDTLAPHGVAVTGGRAGTVGVGGFITGGGNSFHSASHGFACDQVANFEVVLANGSIVNANATSNSDLFQSLKGSGANLGLVTRFDMYVIEFPDKKNPVVWGGNLVYNLTAGTEVINALVDFTENVHKDENSSSIVYWAYIPNLGGTILNAAIENTVGKVKPAAFDQYYATGNIIQDTTKVDRLSTVANELGSGQPAGFRNVWFTLAFDNDARVMNYAVEQFDILNKNLEYAVGVDSGFNTLCMFQPISKSMVDKGVAMGGNVMGLDYYITRGNGIMFLVTLAINGADNEAIAFDFIQAYTDDVYHYAASLDLAWKWKYLNYAHKVQDVIATFGEAAIGKLQAASTKYDPTGVFQKLRLSGFKIPG
ncbi:FAD binding domain-containing protein [Colletotrichum truncatum]|uniref:FAD binding domain-containing protein n=1 Tax=Colletotrichum truncatum TaxID=5467 RepID=A0ACC3YC57_COLTU|nr:FAD binding domain-containing protein [Colletotrichum truncatum]KAF6793888.1 FAD binding domain-containing protein [Colletotrichum truncatum]